MKKYFTYIGKSAALLFSFVLAAIALFMLGVVISLLMNEPKQAEEEASVQQAKEQAEYIEAYNILDNERGESGKVLYVSDGFSFRYFERSGDAIHDNHHVMNEISEIISKKVLEE